MFNFLKHEGQSVREFFQPDELSWLDEKLMFVFYVGLFIFLLPLSYYRSVFSFSGDDLYVQYIRNCGALSCIGTYVLLRSGMFVVRLIVGRVYPGPRI